MAKLDLKKSIRGITFFTRKLTVFGSKVNSGDQNVFDRRGAVTIHDKEYTKRNGEIVKMRSVKDVGGASMVITRPGGSQPIAPFRMLDVNHGWVYACVKAIAEEVANADFRVYKMGRNGEYEEQEDHPLIDFLEAINDFQTGPEFKQMMAAHLELTGNAYILLEGVKDETSQPTAMYLLDPSKVKIILDKTNYPYRVMKYQFEDGVRKWEYQPYQIIQLKYPNAQNPYSGMGSVEGIAEWIDNDNNATEFMRQFFLNGAQIGLTFETEMTSEEQLQNLRDSFIEQHTGVANSWKNLFLPKGVKKPSNDVKFGEIGMNAISDTSRDKILAGFRVSRTILGTADDDTNRATAETADYVFARRTIRPKLLLICSFLNEFLVPRFGDDIFLTFMDPIPDDKKMRSEELKNVTGGLSVMTINEARAEYLDLPSIEGGDDLIIPNNFAPIDSIDMDAELDNGKTPTATSTDETNPDDEGEESSKAFKVKKVYKAKSRIVYKPKSLVKGKTRFARNIEIRKDIKEKLTDKITEIFMTVKKKEFKDLTDQEYTDVVLKEKLERIGKYGQQMKEALIKINDEQKHEVLKNLEDEVKAFSARKNKSFNDLFDYGKWVGIVIDAVTPIANDQFTKESNQALSLIDEPGLDVTNTPSAQKAINHAMKLMSESYNQDTVDILKSKLTEGLEQGLGVQAMGELVQEIYAWKNQVAAERVALTESNRIANTAGKIAWKESGVVTELRWITSGNDVCTYCQAMDDKTIDINDNFFEKGDTVEGTDGATMDLDYSDVGGPPLHPNCHCGMRPVVDRSDKSKAIELEKAQALEVLKDEKKVDEILDGVINEIQKDE